MKLSVRVLLELAGAVAAIATIYSACTVAEYARGRSDQVNATTAADVEQLQKDMRHWTSREVLLDQLLEDWPNYREKMAPVLRDFPEVRDEVGAMHDYLVSKGMHPAARRPPADDPVNDVYASDLERSP